MNCHSSPPKKKTLGCLKLLSRKDPSTNHSTSPLSAKWAVGIIIDHPRLENMQKTFPFIAKIQAYIYLAMKTLKHLQNRLHHDNFFKTKLSLCQPQSKFRFERSDPCQPNPNTMSDFMLGFAEGTQNTYVCVYIYMYMYVYIYIFSNIRVYIYIQIPSSGFSIEKTKVIDSIQACHLRI